MVRPYRIVLRRKDGWWVASAHADGDVVLGSDGEPLEVRGMSSVDAHLNLLERLAAMQPSKKP